MLLQDYFFTTNQSIHVVCVMLTHIVCVMLTHIVCVMSLKMYRMRFAADTAVTGRRIHSPGSSRNNGKWPQIAPHPARRLRLGARARSTSHDRWYFFHVCVRHSAWAWASVSVCVFVLLSVCICWRACVPAYFYFFLVSETVWVCFHAHTSTVMGMPASHRARVGERQYSFVDVRGYLFICRHCSFRIQIKISTRYDVDQQVSVYINCTHMYRGE